VLLVAATAGLYLSALDWFTSRPVAFPLLLPTVWIGLRFRPPTVALHSVAVCTTVVVYTVMGRGPFAALGDRPRQVLVCQLFIALVFSLGILLALSMTERRVLTRSILEARAKAENQARLLSTIIDSMQTA
jgi:integral membrane sensor domain MASE1